ncbi:hypothetical protein NIES4073_74900 [Kalymmatonema gypsitolerans NIES-4073]|nr:hypothetical protein NIES4073_74900 [Scytonema sp. NIES-4073]
MQAIDLDNNVDSPDFVALDKEGQVILIAEFKGFPFHFTDKKTKKYAILRLIDYSELAKNIIPFVMLVDVDNILIFKWDGKFFSEPILCLNTANVLSHYEPEFSSRQIFSLYLTTLTEAWSSDFSYHWKSQMPPASKEMAEIGLLQRLEGGYTQI